MLIGFMHYRRKPTNKAYAFAAVAKLEGAELLFFSPGMVDLQNRKINGYIYDNGEWIKTASRFPDVICNVAALPGERQNQIAEKLYKEIPFTSYSIGDKATVYGSIMKYKEFANYLVPTETVSTVKHFRKLLDKYEEIVLKPSIGRQGIDVYYFKKNDVTQEMLEFISDKISKEEYLVQPYINCRTKLGSPYDLRLHVQKGLSGEWAITKIYPRIAERGSIVCNLARGGHTIELTSFLKKEFGNNYLNIQKSIEIFSLQLAKHMDKIQNNLYKEELDELGIDIGLDANQKIWVYEINWRPGSPPSLNIELNVVKNAIQYALFLANKREIHENHNFYRNP